MSSFQPLPLEISSCAQWHHSQGCAHVKQGGTSIVAALAAIALIAGALLILAQQGYQLGGINALAKMVESQWIYLGMGGAAVLLTLDIALIAVQVRSNQNRSISEDELKKMKVDELMGKELLVERLKPKSYVSFALPAVRTPGQEAAPALYGVHHRTDQNEIVKRYFRDPEEAALYQQELEKAQYVEGLKEYDADVSRLQEGLLNDHFRWIDLSPGLILVVSQVQNVPQIRYFKNIDFLIAADSPYRTLFNQEHMDKEHPELKHIPIPLDENEYWAFEESIAGRMIYFVQRGSGRFYFNSAEERSELIATFVGATDARAHFEKSPQYTEEEFHKYASRAEFLEDRLKPEEYWIEEFSMDHRDVSLIFCITHLGRRFYFKSALQRAEYIKTLPKGSIDRRELEDKIFGSGGIGENANLAKVCSKSQEYWPCQCTVSGVSLQLLLVNREGRFKYVYDSDPKKVLAAIAAGGEYAVDKGYVNARERERAEELEASYFPEQILKKRADYVALEGDAGFGPVAFLFYLEGDEVKWASMAQDQVEAFRTQKGLTHDVKEELDASDRYPKELGRALVPLSSRPNLLKTLDELPKKHSEREFTLHSESKIEGSPYATISVLFVYRKANDFETIFFKNEKAAWAYIDGANITNGFVRNRDQKGYAKAAGRAIADAQFGKDEEKEPFFRFDHPDGKRVCFLVYNRKGEPTEFYVDSSKADDKERELSSSYLFVDLTQVRTLLPAESEALKRRVNAKATAREPSTAEARFNRLSPQMYDILTLDLFYKVLFVRHADEKGARKQDTFYYCSQDPAFAAKITELDQAHYVALEAKIAQELRKSYFVDTLLVQRGEFLTSQETNSSTLYLFYHDGTEIQWKAMEAERLAGYLEAKPELNHDVGKELKESDRYPESLGKALLERSNRSGIRAKLLEIPLRHSEKEYTLFSDAKVSDSAYPYVTVLFVYWEEGRSEAIYFKEEKGAKAYIEKEQLKNSLVRNNKQMDSVKQRGKEKYLEQLGDTKKAPFFRFEHPDGKKVCFITFNPRIIIDATKTYDDPIVEIVPANKAKDKFDELSAKFLFVDN